MKKLAFLKNLTLIICLTFLLSVTPSLFAQDAKAFLGSWNGNLGAMGQTFDISVEFSLDENGKIQGSMDIPAQGAEGINLIDITIEGKKISFVIDGAPGEPTLSGELDEAGTKIEGKFTQGGAEGTFLLEKAAL